jgi:plastocyanin
MSNSHFVVGFWRLSLPLAAAVLSSALMAQAQSSEAPQPSGSEDAKVGNVSGKVNAGKGISVVWVEAAPGMTFPKPAKPVTVSQKNLRFEPHVLAVPVGTTVDFLNSDSVAHNIFWPAVGGDKKLGHSLGTWPRGQTHVFQFDSPGIVPLLCNVHPEMSAYLIVTPTPYLAETDESGVFAISSVPDGSYTVTAWHEGYKIQSKPVIVARDTKVEFTLVK